MDNKQKVRFTKGKFRGRFAKNKNVTAYDRHSELGKNNKGRVAVSKIVESREIQQTSGNVYPIRGSRILDLEYVSQKMFCKICKRPLLLQNIIKPDKPKGLGSTFHVKCSQCETITAVNSSRKYVPPGQRNHVFAINSKVALGK